MTLYKTEPISQQRLINHLDSIIETGVALKDLAETNSINQYEATQIISIEHDLYSLYEFVETAIKKARG